MPRITLQEFSQRRQGDREPLLNFLWHCVAAPFGFDTDYIESVSLPFPTINVKPYFVAGKNVYYPGFIDVAAFDITFYEDQAARTRKFLKEWHERIRHPVEGFYYLPANYKRDFIFELVNTKGEAIMQVKMKNCWPTQSNGLDLVSTGSDRLTIQQNFSTDGMEYL